jgi:ubiquinone/menaquinone biosynthesis C-methylase UbiE
MRRTLYRVSNGLQRAIAPGLRYSQYLYEDVLAAQVHPGTDWLDLGCGHQMLPPWRLEAERTLVARAGRVVGLDYDGSSLHDHRSLTQLARGDASQLPFPDRSFDLVTANMVVEHLGDPARQFREVHRVLRPGGCFLFHTPNLRGYYASTSRLVPDPVKRKVIRALQEREEEDVFPTRYLANTPRRIEELARTAGFDVGRIRLIVSSPQFLAVPPLVLFELLWIRLLMTHAFRGFRTNIIAVLERPAAPSEAVISDPVSA